MFNCRDASWELGPNAFSELYVRPNLCSAPKCLCSDKIDNKTKSKKYSKKEK